MNKMFKYGMGLAAAIALVACSADSISNSDAENWPSDFSVSEYARVNPDLGTYQALSAVADSNAVLRNLITEQLTQAAIEADSSDKTYEQKLASAKTKAEQQVKKTYVTGIILNDDAEWTAYFDDSTAVKEIFLNYAGLSESYWPGSAAFLNGMYNPDSSINIFGQTAMQYRLALNPYHIYGNKASADLAFLKSVPVDSNLIKYQYIRAGRYEGRAYRFCRAGDNAVIKQLDVTVTRYDTTVTVYDTTWNVTERADTTHSATKISYVDADGKDTTMLLSSYQKHLAEGDSSIVPKDTIYTIETKEVKDYVDRAPRDSIYQKKKTSTQAMSPNAAPVGNTGEVWDFSADLYCKSEVDGEVYLIGNP